MSDLPTNGRAQGIGGASRMSESVADVVAKRKLQGERIHRLVWSLLPAFMRDRQPDDNDLDEVEANKTGAGRRKLVIKQMLDASRRLKIERQDAALWDQLEAEAAAATASSSTGEKIVSACSPSSVVLPQPQGPPGPGEHKHHTMELQRKSKLFHSRCASLIASNNKNNGNNEQEEEDNTAALAVSSPIGEGGGGTNLIGTATSSSNNNQWSEDVAAPLPQIAVTRSGGDGGGSSGSAAAQTSNAEVAVFPSSESRFQRKQNRTKESVKPGGSAGGLSGLTPRAELHVTGAHRTYSPRPADYASRQSYEGAQEYEETLAAEILRNAAGGGATFLIPVSQTPGAEAQFQQTTARLAPVHTERELRRQTVEERTQDKRYAEGLLTRVRRSIVDDSLLEQRQQQEIADAVSLSSSASSALLLLQQTVDSSPDSKDQTKKLPSTAVQQHRRETQDAELISKISSSRAPYIALALPSSTGMEAGSVEASHLTTSTGGKVGYLDRATLMLKQQQLLLLESQQLRSPTTPVLEDGGGGGTSRGATLGRQRRNSLSTLPAAASPAKGSSEIPSPGEGARPLPLKPTTGRTTPGSNTTTTTITNGNGSSTTVVPPPPPRHVVACGMQLLQPNQQPLSPSAAAQIAKTEGERSDMAVSNHKLSSPTHQQQQQQKQKGVRRPTVAVINLARDALNQYDRKEQSKGSCLVCIPYHFNHDEEEEEERKNEEDEPRHRKQGEEDVRGGGGMSAETIDERVDWHHDDHDENTMHSRDQGGDEKQPMHHRQHRPPSGSSGDAGRALSSPPLMDDTPHSFDRPMSSSSAAAAPRTAMLQYSRPPSSAGGAAAASQGRHTLPCVITAKSRPQSSNLFHTSSRTTSPGSDGGPSSNHHPAGRWRPSSSSSIGIGGRIVGTPPATENGSVLPSTTTTGIPQPQQHPTSRIPPHTLSTTSPSGARGGGGVIDSGLSILDQFGRPVDLETFRPPSEYSSRTCILDATPQVAARDRVAVALARLTPQPVPMPATIESLSPSPPRRRPDSAMSAMSSSALSDAAGRSNRNILQRAQLLGGSAELRRWAAFQSVRPEDRVNSALMAPPPSQPVEEATVTQKTKKKIAASSIVAEHQHIIEERKRKQAVHQIFCRKPKTHVSVK